jgi:hypothetical protein
MEVIRFDGYTVDEKVAIAKDYLWPRQRRHQRLREDEVDIADDVIQTIVAEYPRSGVRQLERELGKLLRKTATGSPPATRSRRSPSTSRSCATPSADSASGRSRLSEQQCPASPLAWLSPAPAATSCSSRRADGSEGGVSSSPANWAM